MSSYIGPFFPSVYDSEARRFDRDTITALENWHRVLKAILERGISIDDNVDARRVSVVSHVTPGTQFSVAHGLGKVPTGYWVAGQTGSGSIYDGTTSNDATTIYFRSSAASTTFRLVVF